MTIVQRLTGSGRLAGAAVALGMLAASCAAQPTPGGGPRPAGREAAGSSILTLNRMATLRTLFNRAAGHVRLVLIFSPT
jgi:hypothetical protein